MQHQRPQIALPQQSPRAAAPAAGIFAPAVMVAMGERSAREPPFLWLMIGVVTAMWMVLSHMSFSFSMFDTI
jgi:hypothetical protein